LCSGHGNEWTSGGKAAIILNFALNEGQYSALRYGHINPAEKMLGTKWLGDRACSKARQKKVTKRKKHVTLGDRTAVSQSVGYSAD
jgi:hypothetical protein